MIKFEHTEVVGWEHAIRGMRNPMNSWEKSDSGWTRVSHEEAVDIYNDDSIEIIDECDRDEEGLSFYIIGKNDRDLMMQLRNAGTDHRKFMRMITVYVDITAPLYWWKEFDTYKVGTVANSCSTMHKIHAKRFERDDFSHECALPGFVDSKNEEKTERNAGYLVVSQSGGGMLRQGTRKGIRRTPANRGMRAHRIVKSLDISEDVCHGLCP